MSVIWSGITEEGAIVPVQVDDTGRVVSVEKDSGLDYWQKNENTLTPADGEDLLVDGTISSSVSFLGPTASFTEDVSINGLNVGRGGGGSETNTCVGLRALRDNFEGINNTAVGEEALKGSTTGSGNTAIGQNTLSKNRSGSNNTAVGKNCLSNCQVVNNNVAVGIDTLRNNTEGSNNTALGRGSLQDNVSGSNNLALGLFSLYKNIQGSSNTGVGVLSLRNNTTGFNNTALGPNALYFNTEGTNNTALGADALGSNLTGIGNTAVGKNALANNTTGSNNTFVGQNPGLEGLNDTVCISAGTTERLWIDSEGQAGIGTNNPQATLDVAGPALFANGLCGFLATGEIFFQSRNTTYKLVVASSGLVSAEEIPTDLLRLDDREALLIPPFIETNVEDRLSEVDMDIDDA